MSPTTGGGEYYPFPPPFPFSFHLLEVNVISAQDLFPAVRSSMRTYAIAWINPDHKLRTRLDPVGHTDPTWNDKFVFRVDDATLRSDTSAITVAICAARSKLRPGPDTLLGTARAVLSTLRPSTSTRFVALQIRRPNSLRPQGILNVGVTLLDAYVRSLPLYADLSAGSGVAKAIVADPAVDAAEARGLVRSGSARERKELETKLPPLKDDEGEKGEKRDGVRAGRGRSRRTAGKMSCFSPAEEVKEEGGGGRGRGAC